MIKLDNETFKLIAMFQSLTGAGVRDCIYEEGGITFLVEAGDMGKAIGKGGGTVRALEAQLKRKIKIVEFNPELQGFVQNLVAPVRIAGIEEDAGIVRIIPTDIKTRGLLIGRNASTLRGIEAIVIRHFPNVREVRVERLQ